MTCPRPGEPCNEFYCGGNKDMKCNSGKPKECCANCKFYAELKISKRVVSGWVVGKNRSRFDETHCCLMFVKTENEPYVLEIEPNDMCEMFTERE